MKIHTLSGRLLILSLLAACAGSSLSCMTTYDGYGRPVQSVDPGLAVAGVAAAGLIGYAAANNHGHHRTSVSYETHYRHDDWGYYEPACHGGGYYDVHDPWY